MSDWYYLKSGFIEDETVGPISDKELLRLAFEGKLKPDTKVTNPKHTKGQWATVGQIPSARKEYEAGKNAREQAAAEVKAKTQAERDEQRAHKEELKRQRELTREAERQAQAAEKLRQAQQSLPTNIAATVPQLPAMVPQQMASQLPATLKPQLLPARQASRVLCPFCGEEIAGTAIKCRHCNEFLDGRPRQQTQPQVAVAQPTQVNVHTHVTQQTTLVAAGGKRWSPFVAMFLSFLIPGLGQLYKGQAINGIIWFFVTGIGYVAFIIPGLILHLCCIVGAGMGDPYR